jgi:hypothetical protein
VLFPVLLDIARNVFQDLRMSGRLAETLIVGAGAAMSLLPGLTINLRNIRDFNFIGKGVERWFTPPRSQKY